MYSTVCTNVSVLPWLPDKLLFLIVFSFTVVHLAVTRGIKVNGLEYFSDVVMWCLDMWSYSGEILCWSTCNLFFCPQTLAFLSSSLHLLNLKLRMPSTRVCYFSRHPCDLVSLCSVSISVMMGRQRGPYLIHLVMRITEEQLLYIEI